jgi:hypothetical protein
MPAKSQAQAHYMALLYKRGEITRAQLDDWDKGVKVKDLPKHVKGKAKRLTRAQLAAKMRGK